MLSTSIMIINKGKIEMKKCGVYAFCLITVLILGLFFVILKSHSKNDLPLVEIIRQDHSIKNNDGELLANIYYDKLVLEGKGEAIFEINKYFEDEYLNWLNDVPSHINFYQSGQMERFVESVQGWRISNENDLLVHPFYNTIDTDIAFLNHDIISIRHNTYWMAGGVNGNYQFGYNFNLKTGELLPFTHFTNVEADDFRNSLLNFILESDLIDSSNEMTQGFIREYYGPNSSHDFKYYSDGKTYDLLYEYYYDGTDIYLILNEIMPHASVIMKWNGKTGEEFDATLWTYSRKNNALEEYQVYPVTTGVNPS